VEEQPLPPIPSAMAVLIMRMELKSKQTEFVGQTDRIRPKELL